MKLIFKSVFLFDSMRLKWYNLMKLIIIKGGIMGCGQENRTNHYSTFVQLEQIDDITYNIDFTSDAIKNWHEGDHAMLILNVNGDLVGKKLSFASLAEDGLIRFTTRINKEASDYKKTLLSLVRGEEVKISEPSGDFKLRREKRPLVLVSNGVGIAVMRPLMQLYLRDKKDIPKMINMNVDSRSNIYKDEFAKVQDDDFKVYYLSHRASYYSMLYHELKLLSQSFIEKPIVYMSGSDEFVEETWSYLKDLEFADDDLIMGGKQTDSCCKE